MNLCKLRYTHHFSINKRDFGFPGLNFTLLDNFKNYTVTMSYLLFCISYLISNYVDLAFYPTRNFTRVALSTTK